MHGISVSAMHYLLLFPFAIPYGNYGKNRNKSRYWNISFYSVFKVRFTWQWSTRL